MRANGVLLLIDAESLCGMSNQRSARSTRQSVALGERIGDQLRQTFGREWLANEPAGADLRSLGERPGIGIARHENDPRLYQVLDRASRGNAVALAKRDVHDDDLRLKPPCCGY